MNHEQKHSDLIAQEWERYGEWLVEHLLGFTRKRYDCLMNRLQFTPFVYSIDHDRNRAVDGIFLREDYIDVYLGGEGDICPPVEWKPDQASVLEVLVALAFRIDDEYIGNPADPKPELIFWEMCCNLDLQKFMNRYYDPLAVDFRLNVWMMRAFEYGGQGSIFPLKHPRQDQRTIEIWSQMQAYLTEHYEM